MSNFFYSCKIIVSVNSVKYPNGYFCLIDRHFDPFGYRLTRIFLRFFSYSAKISDYFFNQFVIDCKKSINFER